MSISKINRAKSNKANWPSKWAKSRKSKTPTFNRAKSRKSKTPTFNRAISKDDTTDTDTTINLSPRDTSKPRSKTALSNTKQVGGTSKKRRMGNAVRKRPAQKAIQPEATRPFKHGAADNTSTATTYDGLPFVFDMFFMKLGDAQSKRPRNGLVPQATFKRNDYRCIRNALRKAVNAAPLDVAVDHPLGEGKGGVALHHQVTVESRYKKDATKNFRVFILHIAGGSLGDATSQLTVSFSRDRAEKPTRYEMSIQSNPTTLTTGQNVWPAHPVAGSMRAELVLMMNWPHQVLMAVCEQADEAFARPKLLTRSMANGDATVMNLQFALDSVVPEDFKQVVLALIDAAFSTRRVRSHNGSLETFSIGEMLRITPDLRGHPGQNGRTKLESDILRKRSGTHYLGSLSVYDKAVQMHLSPSKAAERGLVDRLRLDITLQLRGLEKLLNDAVRIASANKIDHELDRDADGKVARSVRNLIDAISLIDACYEVDIDGQVQSGFANWLMTRIVCGEFHLGELFSSNEDRWQDVCQYLKRRSRRDKRYTQALRSWKKCEFGNVSLSRCLEKAGLSPGAVARCIAEVRKLGCSGLIPPRYWKTRRALWRTFGATEQEFDDFDRRLSEGKPVRRILKRNRKRIQPAFEALGSAVRSCAEPDTLRRVESYGQAIAHDGLKSRSKLSASKNGTKAAAVSPRKRKKRLNGRRDK